MSASIIDSASLETLYHILGQKARDDMISLSTTISENDMTIQCYQRNLMTVLRFLMKEGDMERFEMTAIRANEATIETYTDDEMRLLLKKPNLRKCSFFEYECWVMVNFLFSTGVRQRSLIHIKVGDVDLDNGILTVRVTKNRKVLVVPINQSNIGKHIKGVFETQTTPKSR